MARKTSLERGELERKLLQPFRPAGPGHSKGVVPDPGGGSGTGLFLSALGDFRVPVGVSGGISPASSVVAETTLGLSSAVGSSTDYARAEHSHGSPSAATIAAAIKLDDLAAPDDNTDLNVSASAHGLMPKLGNDATKYFDGTGAQTVPGGIDPTSNICANMVMNWDPGVGLLTGETATPLEWWDIAAQLTVTVVACIAEGIPDTYGKYAFKIVTSGSGSGAKFSQRYTVADHALLDNGSLSVVSCGWRVYQASGGSTITGRLIDSAATSYGTDTSTDNAWKLIKVVNKPVLTTASYVDASIEVAANSKTFYMIPAGFCNGPTLLPWVTNPPLVVQALSAAVVNAANPTDTSWTAASFAATTHPLAFAIGIPCSIVASTAGRALYIRQTGSSAGQNGATWVTSCFVANGRGVGFALAHCNSAQSVDYSVSNADVSDVSLHQRFYIRWAF